MKLVSSCLIGLCSTYREAANLDERFAALLRAGDAIPVCPEQMGGLPTPRPPAEIQGGAGDDVLDGKARVVTRDGQDVTENYLRGAAEVLKLAQAVNPELIILKERSPSCGVRFIHDGSFSGRLKPGRGVTTALLLRHGYRVVSDEDYLEPRERA